MDRRCLVVPFGGHSNGGNAPLFELDQFREEPAL